MDGGTIFSTYPNHIGLVSNIFSTICVTQTLSNIVIFNLNLIFIMIETNDALHSKQWTELLAYNKEELCVH